MTFFSVESIRNSTQCCYRITVSRKQLASLCKNKAQSMHRRDPSLFFSKKERTKKKKNSDSNEPVFWRLQKQMVWVSLTCA